MCLGIPAKIISINGNKAKVDVGGTEYTAGLHLVENIDIGDYIILHSGYAIEKINEQDAKSSLSLIQEIKRKENSQKE